MADIIKQEVNLSNLVFSENGAVGEGSDGQFYAMDWCGDIYCIKSTREEAQSELDKAEPEIKNLMPPKKAA